MRILQNCSILWRLFVVDLSLTANMGEPHSSRPPQAAWVLSFPYIDVWNVYHSVFVPRPNSHDLIYDLCIYPIKVLYLVWPHLHVFILMYACFSLITRFYIITNYIYYTWSNHKNTLHMSAYDVYFNIFLSRYIG